MIATFSKQCSQSSQQGIVLLEVLIAILIFSMGVLGLVGLQAVMIKNSTDARFRSDASVIAQQRIGAIWADPSNAGLVEVNTDISGTLPGGKRSTSLISAWTNPSTAAVSREYLVTVTWSPPSDSTAVETHNYSMLARVDP